MCTLCPRNRAGDRMAWWQPRNHNENTYGFPSTNQYGHSTIDHLSFFFCINMKTISNRYKPKRVEFVSRKSLKRSSKKHRYRSVLKKNNTNNHQSLLIHTLMNETLCSKPTSMHQALSRVRRRKPWIPGKYSSDPDLNYNTKKKRKNSAAIVSAVLSMHPPGLIESVGDRQTSPAKFASRKRGRVYPSEKQEVKCPVSDAVTDMTKVKSRKTL